MASFLALRGNCLQDNARFEEAAHAYHYACLFAPHIHRYRMWSCVNAALGGDAVPDESPEIKAIALAEKERIAALR